MREKQTQCLQSTWMSLAVACLVQVTEAIEVEETYSMSAHGVPSRDYCIRMRLTDPDTYPPDAGITFEQVLTSPLQPACPHAHDREVAHPACLTERIL